MTIEIQFIKDKLMLTHRWFYQGKVVKIIDGQTVEIWVDLGFEIWKKVLVRFNRIRSKDSGLTIEQGISPEPGVGSRFLEQHLKNKDVYFQIYKKKDFNGFDRFFAEVHMTPGDLPLRLKDVNKTVNNPNRVDGLVNLNDFLVGQGLATFIQFNKEDKNVKFPVRNGFARQYTPVRKNSGSRIEPQGQPIEKNPENTEMTRGL